MDHGKEIRVEIGGVPEAPEFFKVFARGFVKNFEKLGSLRANPVRRRAAAILEGAGPSFKENWNGQNRLGLG